MQPTSPFLNPWLLVSTIVVLLVLLLFSAVQIFGLARRNRLLQATQQTVVVTPAMGLVFAALRAANISRLPTFKNKHGELAHSKPDGSDWSPAQWLQALVGELGELANFRKKFERGDITMEEFAVEAGKELADVQIYLDILALRILDVPGKAHPMGVNLGQATLDKFNEVSERVGSPVRLRVDEWYYNNTHDRPRDRE